MNDTFEMRRFGKQFLRFTFIAIFTWFSCSQFSNPSAWSGIVPAWATATGLDASTIVFMNATLEAVGVVLLAFDRWVKWVMLFLSAHLFVIASGFGVSSTGIRDFGLALSALALSFLEWDEREPR